MPTIVQKMCYGYIARKESAVEERSWRAPKKEKPDSPRLIPAESCTPRRVSVDVMLMIRNESSPAGEGRADDGNGACGGSRYVSALCGGVSSNGVGGLGRAVLDAAVTMEGLGFELLRVPDCSPETPNEVSESLYSLAVSKIVSISANESRAEGSTWRLPVRTSTSFAIGGSAMRGSGVVSGTGIEDNGVLPVASC